MVVIHVLIWFLTLTFSFSAYYIGIFDRAMAEETLWLTVSISVMLYCFRHYQDKLLLFGFSLYIFGQLFDVLDGVSFFANNLFIRFDTGFKNLGFIVICVSLFKRVYEKRNLIARLSAEIENRVALQSQLEFAAMHDELTKVQNRKALFERLNNNAGKCASILYLDLDKFKQANDQFGHATGDKILVEFSNTLSERFGHNNIYRLGGDEFLVLLENMLSPSEVHNVEQELSLDLAKFNVGVSIGYSEMTKDKSPDHVINLADMAMYQCKSDKKGLARVATRS